MASAVAIVIMSKGSRIENFYTSKSFRMGAEFLSNELIENLAEDAVKQCNRLFDAERPPCGEMPVVMGAGSSGILLHEAIGHTFEADFNRKNVSIFSDKMGQKICSEQINIVDDGTVPYNRGAVNFDDEGVPGQKTYLVKDGILNSYLHDRISAKFYGVEPTGNGRRESFRHSPIPRMRATYMENGNGTAEDLIKSVSKGIYVDNFSNGQVQIGAGDFTFYVKSGYLIENGKLTRPIKDANIIGNGPEALADIIAVANDSIIDDSTWSCGKGQYCPVSCGMPSVLVKSLNVGGINE
jgi:TldD protein